MQYLIPAYAIEDDLDDVKSMTEAFDKEGEIDYHFFNNPKEFFSVFNEDVYLVVVDYNLPGMNGQEILDKVLQINPDCHAIIISGVITLEMATRLGLSGAKDCIEKRKGWESRLATAIKRNIELVTPKIHKREQDRKALREIKQLLGK